MEKGLVGEIDDLEKCGDELRLAVQSSNEQEKIAHLNKVKEVFLNTTQLDDLLDSFLEEIIDFVELPSIAIRIYIIEFIEQISFRKYNVIKHAIGSYVRLISQGNIRVAKAILRSCTRLYPVILRWAIEEKNVAESKKCWETFLHIKEFILRLLENENEGLKTMAFKFLEIVIICQSTRSETAQLAQILISLNDVPIDHRFISHHQLKHEATQYLKILFDQMALPHISYQNLIVALGCIIKIARLHVEYFPQVIEGIEILHVNLPPTLTRGQVKSMRKELKKHLLKMLKQSPDAPLQKRVETILIGLGANSMEVERMPRGNQKSKHKRRSVDEPDLEDHKKKRKEVAKAVTKALPKDDDDGADIDEVETPQTAIDITTDYVFERLSFGLVVNLAMISLVTLPNEMPASFQAYYTPIPSVIADEEKMHLSRMLASQIAQAGLGAEGPGVEQSQKASRLAEDRRKSSSMVSIAVSAQELLLKSKTRADNKLDGDSKLNSADLLGKDFDITEDVKPLPRKEIFGIFQQTFKSIMEAESRASMANMLHIHNSLLVRLVSRYHTCHELDLLVVDFIVSEHKARGDLAVLWIIELYKQYQSDEQNREKMFERYEYVMGTLVEKMFHKILYKEMAFHRIYLEAPVITDKALFWLQRTFLDSLYGPFCLMTLRELIIARAKQRDNLVKLLFNVSLNDGTEISDQAAKTIKELYEFSYVRPVITKYLEENLDACLLEFPPPSYAKPGEPAPLAWDEKLYRVALNVYLDLILVDSSLIHRLAKVYAHATNALKKVILRMIEMPIREMSMKSDDIVKLVNECPIGSETLVARITHLLSEKNPITSEIVLGMKRLHKERNTDIRSLIPILSGLSQEEILELLPRLVLDRANQKSVPYVFRRILQSQHPETGQPPISPVDFVVFYHHLEPINDEQRQLHLERILI
ncbi:unnamed protein product, partial [Mesorhabditis belari]|uniref:Symplekin n=1 Tax=Mesorhabditis belari TaxID=2138241 RepID=A0AAF3E8F6_9BILA